MYKSYGLYPKTMDFQGVTDIKNWGNRRKVPCVPRIYSNEIVLHYSCYLCIAHNDTSDDVLE